MISPRALLLLGLLALASLAGRAGAQACPERDVEIEQEGLGVVRADALESEGDVAVLTRACFRLGDLTLDAAVVRAGGEGAAGRVVAEDVDISGAGLSGRAARLSAAPGVNGAPADAPVDGAVFEDLVLDADLPSAALPGLPLPPGRYRLVSTAGEFAAGRFRFDEALLVPEGRPGEVYRLAGAELRGQALTAREARLDRVEVVGLAAAPNLVTAGATRVGLCRVPDSRELELRAASLRADPNGTLLNGLDLRLFGARVPTPSTLVLPARAAGPTLGETASTLLADLETVRARLGRFRPQPVLSATAFGVRDVNLLDDANTRVNAVLHRDYLEFGVRSTLNGYDVALGIFEDANPELPDVAVPQLVVVRRPDVGGQYVFALRGGGELTEFRWGTAARLGLGPLATLRLLGELGTGLQGGPPDAFVRAEGRLNAGADLGPFRVDASAVADLYAFTASSQATLELYARAALAPGTVPRVDLVADHLERRTLGAAPFAALRPADARTTTLATGYSPALAVGPVELRRVGYALTYDGLARALTRNEVNATFAWRGGAATVTPTLAYDFAISRTTLVADIALQSECFDYGGVLEAYTQPDRSSVAFRLRFNLR